MTNILQKNIAGWLSSLAFFALLGCFPKPDKPAAVPKSLPKEGEAVTSEQKRYISEYCISDNFAQGQEKNLYGIQCIKDKQIVIQTDKKGAAAHTSQVVSNSSGGGLRLEGNNIDFINKFYPLNYAIVDGEGDIEHFPFLKDFLSEDKKLFGSPGKYRIVFKTSGNYLILFKASKNLKDIPYTERTSMIKEGDYYMTPFIGYLVEYCHAENIKNTSTGKPTNQYRAKCDANHSQNVKYLRVSTSNPYLYKYYEGKKDIFPASYFGFDKEDRWFFSEGLIEKPTREGEMSPRSAYLVELEQRPNELVFIDVSGTVADRNQRIKGRLAIEWLDYEMDQNGSIFEYFGERRANTEIRPIDRAFLKIRFQDSINKMDKISVDGEPLAVKSGAFIDLLISKDYFSYIFELDLENEKKVKYKVSLLRKKAVQTEGFAPKRWFLKDHQSLFGVLAVSPQTERRMESWSEDSLLFARRMIRFNTSAKETVIKWHFSKNTPPSDPEDPLDYRDIARLAVEIWNQAFEHITQGTGKKIRLVLAEEEDKDLGDLRYNVINLIKTRDLSGPSTGFLGIAPSYVYSDTGQIIGTTANVVVHNVEIGYLGDIRHYIRYEIFQKDKKTDTENETHVVSPYIRSKIAKECPEIRNFINDAKHKNLKPRDALNDEHLHLACAQKIAKEGVLLTLLHEMGHNFGLAHNFKGSLDKDNYWESVDEIKNIFPVFSKIQKHFPSIDKTENICCSSIMDYIPSTHKATPLPGKYDLAVLKFLYLNRLELKKTPESSEDFLSLNIPEDPLKQKSLSSQTDLSSKMKNYLYCADKPLRGENEDFLCLLYDYGSSPLETVTFYIERFKRRLNLRYRYDIAPLLWKWSLDHFSFSMVQKFYERWIRLRDEHLDSKGASFKAYYKVADTSSIDSYEKTLEEGLQGTNKDYKSFYKIRSAVADFLMDLMFLETMKCRVQDSQGQSLSLNLEYIKETLQSQWADDIFYVEDCYSPQIGQFFAGSGLEMTGQTGLENFDSFYPRGKEKRADVFSFKSISAEIHRLLLEKTEGEHKFIHTFAYEPGFFEKFRKRMEALYLTDKESNQDNLNASLYLQDVFITSLARILVSGGEEGTKILNNNYSYFTSIRYAAGTGASSFYQKVIFPLSTGTVRVSSLNIPFLSWFFDDYLDQYNSGGFNYSHFAETLINSDSVLNDILRTNSFFIPYQPDNLIQKAIVKYNENSKRLEEYKRMESEGLSPLDVVRRKALIQHNDSLKAIIQRVIKD